MSEEELLAELTDDCIAWMLVECFIKFPLIINPEEDSRGTTCYWWVRPPEEGGGIFVSGTLRGNRDVARTLSYATLKDELQRREVEQLRKEIDGE